MSKKVVTFGEVMMRLAPPGYQRFLQANSFDATYAGGEANVAASLAQFSHGRYVLVHPDTAKPLGIAHGDTVRIKTATGSVEAVAELTASIRPGIIFTPSHFTGTSPHAATRSKPINAILPNYWDRVSAQFNGVGCTLEKA